MSLGPLEIILILVVVLLLFGAKKLPEIGKGLGEWIRELRHAGRELIHPGDQPPNPPGRD
ncbi:twin-arginine translocase TatA/TatE family subunit [Deinococcus marmoris]|uniref:Sec-independent protein translocase protein TatA n=1 Tax=Deinococcus marmoris TaxID=249408 RepID=A0A1U7NS07_9DEIO|nr:twin-arginine translocase TatA/TatE family subunit [Deinococcus marmoris]OLV15700.1 Twin-arginine translocation protein TatA [Deinococcus marmoris]